MNLGTDFFERAQALLIAGGLVAAILPYVTAIITRRHWSDQVKIFIAALLALLGSVITLLLTGELQGVKSVVAAFTLIFPVSQIFFATVALKLGLRKLEAITTPASARENEEKE